MTVEEARAAYKLDHNWIPMELTDGRIIFSFFDVDKVVRPDGTAYMHSWVLTRDSGHQPVKTELTPEAT